MNKKVYFLAIVVFLAFFNVTIYAFSQVTSDTTETIVLKLCKDVPMDWKEIGRHVVEVERKGLVEYIPSDQNSSNWSKLVCIQYFDNLLSHKGNGKTLEDVIDSLRKTVLDSHPGNKVTWRVVEKNKSDFIYEWILHKPFKDIPPQHEISRLIVTDHRLHRIGYTRQHKKMSSKERETWLKLLRNSVSIVSVAEARKTTQTLSLVDQFSDSIDLGEAFKTWKITESHTFDNGYSMLESVPSSFNAEKGENVSEGLKLRILPRLHCSTLDGLLQADKKIVQELSSKAVEFSILKKTSTESIFSFAYPEDNLQVTGVFRTFLVGQEWYSMHYYCTSPTALKTEEIQQWKERLEAVKVQKAL